MIALWLACSPPAEVAPHPWHLTDDEGRMVVHRGVNLNSAAKSRDGGYHHGLDDDELAIIAEAGFTLVRLLVFWEAIEPEDGVIDAAYLDRVRDDVAALDALGLDVVLDLHQDVYGEGFGYTGFPRWTCDEAAYAAFTPNGGSWFLDYFDENVVACFDAFWASDTLQERYAAIAARLVAEVGDAPGVVGLDVMNEPFWGSLTREAHDEVVLPAFYARVIAAVRAEDDDLPLWLEPSVYANLDADPRLPIGDLGDDHLVFAPHFYPAYAELGTGYDGDFTDEAVALDRLTSWARREQVPFALGEFGIFSDTGTEAAYVADVLDAVASDGGSGVWWSMDRGTGLLTDDGAPGALVPAFAGPWLHRAPGRVEAAQLDGARVTLYGDGQFEFVAPDDVTCGPVAEGRLVVVGMSRDGLRRVVTVSGHGEGRLGLACR